MLCNVNAVIEHGGRRPGILSVPPDLEYENNSEKKKVS